MDAIVPYGCRVPADECKIPGALPVEAPEPLLPNWGQVGQMTYYMDMAVRLGNPTYYQSHLTLFRNR
jgi:hypothetical protein